MSDDMELTPEQVAAIEEGLDVIAPMSYDVDGCASCGYGEVPCLCREGVPVELWEEDYE